MTFSIEFDDDNSSYEYDPNLKVVGVGGAGGNAVNTMISFGLEGVEFVAANTDALALNANAAPVRLPLGQNITRGLGAGADPEKGRKAAMEDVTQIKEVLAGADMVFITAGMGGGTGTGAAPVIAQVAREEGALTVGVVTKPFAFEGKRRSRQAELGLQALTEQVDTLITIPNQKLLALDEDLAFTDAFRKADEVLYQAVKGINDLVQQNGLVNVDFADVKTIMSNMGRAIMGTGAAKGDGRARLAAEMAISSPLLDNISVEGAMGVLINIVGGPDLRMSEMQEATALIYEQAHEDANIIWGASIEESMGDTVKVTVIATGFDQALEEQPMEELTARPVSVNVPQQLVTPRTTRREPARQAPARSMRVTEERAPAPVATTRRPITQRPATVAVSRRSAGSSFPPNSTQDVDWDIPAFTRRGGR